MILTRWINVRLGAIVLAAVLLQVTFFSYLSIFGTSPDFVVVVTAVVGLLGGALIGAVTGFVAGLLLDVSLLETLGVSSLVLLSVGYLAGRYRENFEIDSLFAPAAVTGALALFASAGLTALQLTLEVETGVSGAVVTDSIVKGFLAFLLAYPTYPLIRRALRPALVLEGAPARRSTRTAPAARAAGKRRPGFLRGRKKGTPSRRKTPSSRVRQSAAQGGELG
jgi:rod shape-determining protein MreD